MHQSNALPYCNTLCQYSAVKNNFKRLPAFTKLWSFDLCCWFEWRCFPFKVTFWKIKKVAKGVCKVAKLATPCFSISPTMGRATGQIENMRCINRALIKLMPLKWINVLLTLTLTALIYIYIHCKKKLSKLKSLRQQASAFVFYFLLQYVYIYI